VPIINLLNDPPTSSRLTVGPATVPPGLDPTTDAPGDGFEYNAVAFRSNFGGDDAGGWPEINGQYHYMTGMFLNLPTGSAESAASWSANMLSNSNHAY